MTTMTLCGLVLLVMAIVLFFIYRVQTSRASLIEATETHDVEFLQELANKTNLELGAGSFKNYITEVKGQIICDDPLVSELSQTDCVYYKMSVVREYEETYYERDEKGIERRKTRTGSTTVAQNNRSRPFYVEDATGKIYIDPTNAEMVAESVLSRYENSQGRIKIGSFGINIDAYDGSKRILGYRFTEEAIPVGKAVFILGAANQRNGELCITSSSGREKFIISIKSEKELLESAQSTAWWCMLGTITSGVGGAILVVLGFLLKK